MQQQLGAADPSLAAYIWWPSDNEAGVASLQALYDSGVPVIQTNQLPFPGSEEFIVGYAGVNDTFNGEVAAGARGRSPRLDGRQRSDAAQR